MSESQENRIIFHIDVNSAFLSWEAVYRLRFLGETEDLREIPSAVCGSQESRHGIVLAKSLPAKAYGIRTAETTADALRKCPCLKIVPPRYALYEMCSSSFMEILREYTPFVEQYSIDEAFMDMTGTCSLHGSPVSVAHQLKDRIHRELGFTVNVGISSTKLLAKMASDFRKPNLVHTLFPEEMARKMWPLPAAELFSVGLSTAHRLRTLGIHTIGDLAHFDRPLLIQHLGRMGSVIHDYANGIDPSPVMTEAAANKGYGNSITVDHDLYTLDEMYPYLLALCETVGMRLRQNQVHASVASVSLRDCNLRRSSHQVTLESPTHVTSQLYHVSCSLLKECWDGTPIRQIGVHTSGVTEESNQQLDLFSGDRYLRQEKLESAIDQIRARFGSDSVMRARFLQSDICHMSGGIKRDKLNPDRDNNSLLDESRFDPARNIFHR